MPLPLMLAAVAAAHSPSDTITASVAIAVTAAQPKAAAQVEIRTSKIGDGVYKFTVANDGYVERLNCVAIINDKDVLVFDTTTRPSSARHIISEIRRLTSKPVRFIVNSHWHPDHWSGNEVFVREFPDVQIIATERERDFMLNTASLWASYLPKALADQEKAVAEQDATGLDASGIPLTSAKRAANELDLARIRGLVAEQLALKRVYPTLTYTDRLILRHGGREFHFISVTGDAAGTTALYLPREGVLLTGDAVSYPLPYYTPPLSEHAKSLRDLAALGAKTIVPGHGPVFYDNSYMLLEAELFDEVLRQVQRALREGAVSIDDVQSRVNFDSLKDRFARGDVDVAAQFGPFTRGMVRKAYIELRDTKEIR